MLEDVYASSDVNIVMMNIIITIYPRYTSDIRPFG